MPRFKDENDFPDREVMTTGGRSFSSDQLFGLAPVPQVKRDVIVVNGPEAGPERRFDSDAQSWPMPELSPTVKDDDDRFVEVRRPDDRRRAFGPRSSSGWPSTLWGTSARVITSNVWKPVFEAPEHVLPCIERKVRREVLFAKKRHGGGGSRRRRRRQWTSTIKC